MKSVVLALALASSASAFAVSTNLGVLNVNGAPEGFGNILLLGAPVFSDSFDFALPVPATVGGLVGWSGIDAFALVLKDGGGDTVDVDFTPSSFTFALAAGLYSLNFVGFGAHPASFYGGIVGVATPVPESKSYALMLAGLGVMGLLISRRRREH